MYKYGTVLYILHPTHLEFDSVILIGSYILVGAIEYLHASYMNQSSISKVFHHCFRQMRLSCKAIFVIVIMLALDFFLPFSYQYKSEQ